MKVNASKVLMGVAIIAIAILLLGLPKISFGQPLVNPVLTYLDENRISYIAKVERSTLVIYVLDGTVNLEKVNSLAKAVDLNVAIRDDLSIK